MKRLLGLGRIPARPSALPVLGPSSPNMVQAAPGVLDLTLNSAPGRAVALLAVHAKGRVFQEDDAACRSSGRDGFVDGDPQ